MCNSDTDSDINSVSIPVQLTDRAALVDDVLVLSDLHLGLGDHPKIAFSLDENTTLFDRFSTLLDRFEPREVVFAGDVLHSFSRVPDSVSETLTTLSRLARENGVRIVVTLGNHDTMLGSVWSGPTRDEYRIGETVVLHGHAPPEQDASRYVVGHDHPAITIEGRKWPCYLYGPEAYRNSDVLVLPAFSQLTRGWPVNGRRESDRSPLVPDIDRFHPIVHDESETTRTFPPLGEFRRLL